MEQKKEKTFNPSNRCMGFKPFIFKLFPSTWSWFFVLFILTAGLCLGLPAVSHLPGLRGSRRPWTKPSVSCCLSELLVLLPSWGGRGEQEDRLLLCHLVGRGSRTHHLVSKTAGCRAACCCFFFKSFLYLEFGVWRWRAPMFFKHCVTPLKCSWTSCCAAAAPSNEAVTSDSLSPWAFFQWWMFQVLARSDGWVPMIGW